MTLSISPMMSSARTPRLGFRKSNRNIFPGVLGSRPWQKKTFIDYAFLHNATIVINSAFFDLNIFSNYVVFIKIFVGFI